jgi:hypothetical protein
MEEIDSQPETTAPEDGKGSQRVETGIQDLPTELLLDIFEYLSMKELCLSVVPICKQWFMLSKHPCLWKELTFSRNHISTEKVCELIRRSQLLRKLTLHRRKDTNVILRVVFASCLHLETLEIVRCRGSRTVRSISAFTLSRFIKHHPKLRNLTLRETHVNESYFSTLLQAHTFRLKNTDTTTRHYQNMT